MRLTLFLFLLFSVLSGSHASATRAAVGTQVFYHSGKHFSAKHIQQGISLHISVGESTSAKYFISADVEDEEDSDNLSLKKAKATSSSCHIITLSRLHRYKIPSVTVCGILSCKYITQRNLRI